MVDTSASESQVDQAEQLLQTQNYEQSIQLAGAAMQSAQRTYYVGDAAGAHAADGDGGRPAAPGCPHGRAAVERRQLRRRRRDGRRGRHPRAARLPRLTPPLAEPDRGYGRRLLVRATPVREAGKLEVPQWKLAFASATIVWLRVGESSHQPSLHARAIMILGKIWKAIAAQFNKLANAIRGYDPIAEMQYEYDRSVEQIKEGREGLAQYRAWSSA